MSLIKGRLLPFHARVGHVVLVVVVIGVTHVITHDVGVADDGGVVVDLADAVDDEHEVGDVGQPVRVLAQLSVTSEQPLANGFAEAERGREAAIELGARILSMQVDLFG